MKDVAPVSCGERRAALDYLSILTNSCLARTKGNRMHQFLYTFFIAVTNNADNVAARIAYSIRGIRISTPINVWISIITFFISSLAAFSGTMVSGLFGKHLASIIGMVILTCVGLWMILEPFVSKPEEPEGRSQKAKKSGIFGIMMKPEKADADDSKHLDFKEATFLGVALSINNIGGGLSAGMIGLNPFWVGLLSAVINYIALWGGNYIAEAFIKWKLADRAGIVAGMILIAIGIEQLM